ncbi:MAG: hypothetical protein A2987_03225 [Omnitrophica bacterium RIFCSPLOWO2_01_FULL_45_10]|nr:MAG: hypothetical protein A2987_03225 [Omnitrophica bacterium RIFCSPLOWO2_01_FULL_45_10]
MILYLLYRIGYFLVQALPLKVSYILARSIADIYYCWTVKDKRAVLENLKVITGGRLSAVELNKMGRDVFRNFAKYLADFFRSSKIDSNYVKRFIGIEGLENLKSAMSKGKGVILLSAHIANWELGAVVLGILGYNISVVVLTHQNKKINAFFTRQRVLGNVKPIEIGIALRSCYKVLGENGLLGLLGDRDFSKTGIKTLMFGKPAIIPKGPAVFSYRLGSIIVPTFMIRKPDEAFRFIFDPPIEPAEILESKTGDEEAGIQALTKAYIGIIESYIKQYPTQWFMFKEFWSGGDKESLRPDTII